MPLEDKEKTQNLEAFLARAEAFIQAENFEKALTTLEFVINDIASENPKLSIKYEDDSFIEYCYFDNPFESRLYIALRNSTRQIKQVHENFPRIYLRYGSMLLELQRYEEARKALEQALRWNPVKAEAFFKLADIYKIERKLPMYRQITMEGLAYAYTRHDASRYYRNLGSYYLENREYDLATGLFYHSLGWNESLMARSELAYIAQITHKSLTPPADETLQQLLGFNQIPLQPHAWELATKLTHDGDLGVVYVATIEALGVKNDIQDQSIMKPRQSGIEARNKELHEYYEKGELSREELIVSLEEWYNDKPVGFFDKYLLRDLFEEYRQIELLAIGDDGCVHDYEEYYLLDDKLFCCRKPMTKIENSAWECQICASRYEENAEQKSLSEKVVSMEKNVEFHEHEPKLKWADVPQVIDHQSVEIEEIDTQLDNGETDEEAQDAKSDGIEVAALRKTAKAGDADAQFSLADMYYYGDGIRKNYAKAFSWYQKAAEAGNVDAQYNLGFMYEYEQGTELDFVQAVFWYRKAAKAGYADAQFSLGLMYHIGNGVRKNYAQAFLWYSKAAEIGNVDAQYSLGLMYFKGQGTKQDNPSAFFWLQKAAEAEDSDAQYFLGLMYENGQGVQQDYDQAIFWYGRASTEGNHREARKSLKLLQKNHKFGSECV